ncbi:PEP-CTERM sorting domain-containing protein [Cognaticolwellia mytili]|uniref:PEP-CTERM sorting domain-containing protein n=1 Tax=Cognaticolwellia mytili TaxID=1888913 RepID=UPI000A170274|nr:PEP-CTERM sorting domain-containing protein [Cognaticolwellia mytili]
MFKLINKIGFSVSLMALSTFANASLITNGSFEQLDFADNSQSVGIVSNTNLQAFQNKNRAWDVFNTLPGWVTSYGNGIELQKNVVTRSQNGSQHVELDSHQYGSSNSVMTQTLDSLTIGSNYLLEFYYKARTNAVNDNGINVFWYDAAVDFDINMSVDFSTESTKRLAPDWSLQSVMFTAKAESMALSFGAFGKQNTLGGLLDNVSLTQQQSLRPAISVPEPSMLILFAIGVSFIVARKRKWMH